MSGANDCRARRRTYQFTDAAKQTASTAITPQCTAIHPLARKATVHNVTSSATTATLMSGTSTEEVPGVNSDTMPFSNALRG